MEAPSQPLSLCLLTVECASVVLSLVTKQSSQLEENIYELLHFQFNIIMKYAYFFHKTQERTLPENGATGTDLLSNFKEGGFCIYK